MRNFVAFVLTLAALLVVYGLYHDRQAEAHFRSITPQIQEKQVIAVMGQPSQTVANCLAINTSVHSTDCDHTLVYRSTFSAIHPNYWLIFIDRSGLTTATARDNRP